MKRHFPLIVLVACVLAVLVTLRPKRSASTFDLEGFGRLPVLVNGRVKPYDTVARTSLLVLQGRQPLTAPDGTKLAPEAWLLDVLFRPEKSDAYQTFEIVHPDLLTLFNLKPEDGAGKKRFSLNQLKPAIDELTKQARLAAEVETPNRNAFQRAVLQIHNSLSLYQKIRYSIVPPDTADLLADLKRLQTVIPDGLAAVRAKEAKQSFDEKAHKEIMDFANRFAFLAENSYLHPIPPASEEANIEVWRSMGSVLQDSFSTRQIDPSALALAGLSYAWREQKAPEFNEIVRLFRDQLSPRLAIQVKKSSVETWFNESEPFYTATVLFGLAFLLGVLSWLWLPQQLGRSGQWVLLIAYILTTAGIITRMWLESRPPVTNLYSSALGVGWTAVTLCVVLEWIYRNAIGTVAGGFVGMCALIVAHMLALGGDTMEMMRAVLDSNFWLATHVVTITLGYGATFLAGFLALIYIFRGVFTSSLDRATASSLVRMVYGTVCFAALFSFVGTVLGGIWADQSWGRFWGWDPKENGALLIVLWNGVILHARWGGLIRERGLMTLAVFGNIVTAWSWFGTNMLGVGLHSYGFMDAAFWALVSFVASQLAAIAVGSVPLKKWRSFKAT